MTYPRRILVLVFALLVCSTSFGQKVTKVKPGSADFKAVIQAVTPYANAHAAYPVRVTGDVMRRSGDWVFILSKMAFVNPKHQGDGALMAILKKGRRWTIRDITVGSGGLEDMAAEWEKKFKLPKGLVIKD